MTVQPELDEVRKLVVQTLRDLGASTPDLFDLEETALIDDGKYVARSYRIHGYMAMWLIDVGIVQFYDVDGNMLATVNLLKESKPVRKAA